MLDSKLNANYSNKYNSNNIILFKDYRINVLTNHIIRIEKSINKSFIDNPTEMVINRNTADVSFNKEVKDNNLYITTSDVIFKINSINKIKVSFDSGKTFIKEGKNLYGTRTTLDTCSKKCKLDKGIMSRNGLSIIDDSKSMIFDDDGALSYRNNNKGYKDIYVFASLNYKELLNEYFNITGNIPLIPRYAFGNWFSRYWRYTEKTYLELMDKFIKYDTPLSVSVIDCDWHYFKTSEDIQPFYDKKLPRFHNYALTGWTGYNFNKKLFPDPKRFFNELKERGLKATVNLHMNEGIMPHEEQYPLFKKEFGANGKLGEVDFRIGNPEFINAYFKYLMHPLENTGVNFFWLDWQQWQLKKEIGVDPLFSLNHFHFIDNSKDDNRGLILSRYSGLGAHRYPVGFSGDTIMNWKILNFIPYFTSTATNVGYELWSHDIGGHMFGYSDDELYIRWMEFGCFSPINRLHSCNFIGTSKEPWVHTNYASETAKHYLRLRNKLVPYMYSSLFDLSKLNNNFIEPLYYEYNDELSYKDKNSYLLGKSLLVHPITTKKLKFSQTSIEDIYIPEDSWIDVFSKEIYDKGIHTLSKEVNEIPVLLKKSGILPLSYDYHNTNNPDTLEIISYSGNGSYDLFEDDGESNNYKSSKYAITSIINKTTDKLIKYNIDVKNSKYIGLNNRSYIIKPIDIIDCDSVDILINGKNTNVYKRIDLNHLTFTNEELNNIYNSKFDFIENKLLIVVSNVLVDDSIELIINNPIYRQNKSYDEYIDSFISKSNISNINKVILGRTLVGKGKNKEKKIKSLLINNKIKKYLLDINKICS